MERNRSLVYYPYNLLEPLSPEQQTFLRALPTQEGFYNLTRETLIPRIQRELKRCPALEILGDVNGYKGVFVGTDSAKKQGRQFVFLLDKPSYDAIKEKIPGRVETNGYKDYYTIENIEPAYAVVSVILDEEKQPELVKIYDEFVRGEYGKFQLWYQMVAATQELPWTLYMDFMSKDYGIKEHELDNKEYWPFGNKHLVSLPNENGDVLFLKHMPTDMRILEDSNLFRQMLGLTVADKVFDNND
jgi:hypothetical protein